MSVQALVNAGQRIMFQHLVSRRTVIFPAFITQFEDQFASDWNEEYAFGRMDPISTFKRTGRKINLGFQVVAESESQAVSNLGKISTLVKMLYPSYSSGEGERDSSTHMAGPPLMKMKFMNLIQNSATGEELLGYVGGFSNSPILDSGFIEVGPGSIYPKAYDVSCTFTVLHTHKVGWYGTGDEKHFGDDRDLSINYPYRSPDPNYNEVGQDGLTGGYSGIDPGDEAYLGLESIEGGASMVSEPGIETRRRMSTDDFPESLPTESQQENEAADRQQILESMQDDNLNMSGG